VSGDEFPAVTEPYFLSNTGFNACSCSIDVSVLMPLSLVSAVSYRGGTQTGAISAVRRPSSVPTAASRCERSAKLILLLARDVG